MQRLLQFFRWPRKWIQNILHNRRENRRLKSLERHSDDLDNAKNNYKRWKLIKKYGIKDKNDLYPYKNEVVATPGRDLTAIFFVAIGLFVVFKWGSSVVSGWIEPQHKNPVWQATQTAIYKNKDIPKVSYRDVVPDQEQQETKVPVQVEIIVPTSIPEVYVTREVIMADKILYPGPIVVAKFSNYYPPFGGMNCHAENCDLLADGSSVQDVINKGWKVCACPEPFVFGTLFEFPPGSGVLWECRDRGGMITYSDDKTFFWLDFFTDISYVDYGAFIQVRVVNRSDALYNGWQEQ